MAGMGEAEDAYQAPLEIPDNLVIPFVVPQALAAIPANITLADLYFGMADYANLALGVFRTARACGLGGMNWDDIEEYKSYIAPIAVEAAELTYNMIASKQEVYRLPRRLIGVLDFLGVPWPPLAIDATVAAAVVAVDSIVIRTNGCGLVIMADGVVHVMGEGIAMDIRGVEGLGFHGVVLGKVLAGALGVKGYGHGFPALPSPPLPEGARRAWPPAGN